MKLTNVVSVCLVALLLNIKVAHILVLLLEYFLVGLVPGVEDEVAERLAQIFIAVPDLKKRL